MITFATIRAMPWKTIAYAAALFIAGGVTGATIGVAVEKGSMFRPPRPHDMAQQMRNRLRSRLALTPEQLQKIDPIIKKTSDDLNAIHQETVARAAQITENCNAQIAASLSPEQKQKMEQMEKEHRGFLEEYQHHDNHGPGHGHSEGRRTHPPPDGR